MGHSPYLRSRNSAGASWVAMLTSSSTKGGSVKSLAHPNDLGGLSSCAPLRLSRSAGRGIGNILVLEGGKKHKQLQRQEGNGGPRRRRNAGRVLQSSGTTFARIWPWRPGPPRRGARPACVASRTTGETEDAIRARRQAALDELELEVKDRQAAERQKAIDGAITAGQLAQTLVEIERTAAAKRVQINEEAAKAYAALDQRRLEGEKKLYLPRLHRRLPGPAPEAPRPPQAARGADDGPG